MRYVAGESFHAKKCAFIGITFLRNVILRQYLFDRPFFIFFLTAMKTALFLLLALGVCGLVGYGLYRSYSALKAFDARVQEKFLEPYFALIRKGDYETAYKNFTTDGFKKRYSLKDYEESYRGFQRLKGELRGEVELTRVDNLSGLDGSKELRLHTVSSWGEKKYAKGIMFYAVEQADGSFLNDNAVSSGVGDGFTSPF